METNNIVLVNNERYDQLLEAETLLNVVKSIVVKEAYPRDTLATVLGIGLDVKGAE